MKDNGYEAPSYGRGVIMRILRAREKARGSPHRAWLLGHSEFTGDSHYTVYSQARSSGQAAYTVVVRNHPLRGGYCYSDGLEPIVFMACDCEAYRGHQQPCWHCAKVQLRLEREAAGQEKAGQAAKGA